MAKNLYDVTYSIGATDDTAAGIKTATDSLTSPIERIERKWNSLNKALGIGAGILIAREGMRKLAGVAREFEEFLEQQDREAGFENLAKSVNTNTQKIVADLKKASHETLTYDEILSSASEALFKDLQPDQLPKLMELARASTKITGRDLRSTFDSVTQAVAMHSERMLKSQGIIIDYDEAQKKLAKTLGINKSELNDAQQSLAFYNATLEAGSRLTVRTASEIDSLNDSYRRQKVIISEAWKGLKDFSFNLIAKPAISGLSSIISFLTMLDQKETAFWNKVVGWEAKTENVKRMATSLKDLEFDFPSEFTGIPRQETVVRKWTEEDDKKFFDRQEKLVDWAAKASQTEAEFWKKFDEDFAKSQDDRFKGVMDNLDANMAEIEAKLKAEEERVKNTFGYRLGASLGEGFSYGAKTTMSNGLYDLITNQFNAKSALVGALKLSARIFSESFAEEFLKTLGMKFSPAKFLLNLFTTAGQAVATGTVSGTGTGGGTGGVPSLTQGFYPSNARGNTNNTFNYYITDDPTLQKRINEGVRKSFRDNNLRQDVKGLN